jgi:hypothetical protein
MDKRDFYRDSVYVSRPVAAYCIVCKKNGGN